MHTWTGKNRLIKSDYYGRVGISIQVPPSVERNCGMPQKKKKAVQTSFWLQRMIQHFQQLQLSLCRTMYLLGYIPKDDRLYLGDKELNIVSYSLLVSVLEYQTAVMRRDFGMADKVLPTIPKEQRTRVAHFLEKQVRK